MTRLGFARLVLIGPLLLWPAAAAGQPQPSPALSSYVQGRAAEARFPPDKREEANRPQFEIARCFQSRR